MPTKKILWKLTVLACGQLLAGCIKSKHSYSKALELVEELQQSGLKMDDVIYGTLLAICASNSKLEEAETYFIRMKEEGHSPNLFHFSSLLNAYSASGDYKKAEAVVRDIKYAGLVPNKVCFHAYPKKKKKNCQLDPARCGLGIPKEIEHGTLYKLE